ncbi:MAG TPA: acyl-ACP--UDP-N-acetylglucosamine O-acyltransferase [Planctomycetota bacterium]|nr:acyl-ACP--UDP-N-acetylglucosamine O-acyltransferase [Planctomycetota bacterium]
MEGTAPTRIHPTAVIDPSAEIGPGCDVGPYAVVRAGVQMGANCRIGAWSSVGPWVRLGRDNTVYDHAAVGGDPQDKSWRGEPTWLVLGDGNQVREFATLNRGTSKGDGVTRIGNRNLFMACSHVAHDCTVGDGCVFANNVLLAGHVFVEDGAILNGAAGVQQFTTVGRLAYVGGLTRIVHDVPPYMIVEGNPAKVRKPNVVGMQRAGVPEERIAAVREAHRMLFRSKRPQSEVLDELVGRADASPETLELVAFLRRVEKGANGRAREKK